MAGANSTATANTSSQIKTGSGAGAGGASGAAGGASGGGAGGGISSGGAGGQTQAQMLFIKVHLYSTLEVKQTTTVALAGDMLLADVLQLCCKKRKIDPNDYTLKMADTKTDIPLDRTLESLGISELCLLKKSSGVSGEFRGLGSVGWWWWWWWSHTMLVCLARSPYLSYRRWRHFPATTGGRGCHA